MKLVVQVPCLNEEETLPSVLQSIPRSDRRHRRDHRARHRRRVDRPHRRGRPVTRRRPTSSGTRATRALRARSKTASTTRWSSAPTSSSTPTATTSTRRSASPTWSSRSSRARPTSSSPTVRCTSVEHFSPAKKALQKLGSRVVNRAAGTDLPDAASGFRAYSRESLMRLNTITRFSYCMETIIQAGNKRLMIESIPVVTNAKTRESRLFKSTAQHVMKSACGDHPRLHHVQAVRRSSAGSRPSSRCSAWSRSFATPCWSATGNGGGHLQSLIVGAVLLILVVPQRDARDHLRPDPHQPDPHRGQSRAHQKGDGSRSAQATKRTP